MNNAYYLQGILCLEQGKLDAARAWAERSYDILQEIQKTSQVAGESWGFYVILAGRIAVAQGDLPAARRHIDRSVEIFKDSSHLAEQGRSLYWSAALSGLEQKPEQAKRELTAARAIFERLARHMT